MFFFFFLKEERGEWARNRQYANVRKSTAALVTHRPNPRAYVKVKTLIRLNNFYAKQASRRRLSPLVKKRACLSFARGAHFRFNCARARQVRATRHRKKRTEPNRFSSELNSLYFIAFTEILPRLHIRRNIYDCSLEKKKKKEKR